MRHSNIQQLEQKYKEELDAARMSDKELFELKKDLAEFKQNKEEEAGRRGRRNAVRFYCGTIFLILFTAAAGLIFYFYSQIKDTVTDEYLKQKQAAPEKIQQLQDAASNAQEKIDQAQQAYEKAEQTYLEAKALFEQLKSAKNTGVEKLNQARTSMDEAEKKLKTLEEQLK